VPAKRQRTDGEGEEAAAVGGGEAEGDAGGDAEGEREREQAAAEGRDEEMPAAAVEIKRELGARVSALTESHCLRCTVHVRMNISFRFPSWPVSVGQAVLLPWRRPRPSLSQHSDRRVGS
jgi:hypothetical protein